MNKCENCVHSRARPYAGALLECFAPQNMKPDTSSPRGLKQRLFYCSSHRSPETVPGRTIRCTHAGIWFEPKPKKAVTLFNKIKRMIGLNC